MLLLVYFSPLTGSVCKVAPKLVAKLDGFDNVTDAETETHFVSCCLRLRVGDVRVDCRFTPLIA